MDSAAVIKYYSRHDVQNAIANVARDREVAGANLEGGYFKRPDAILYPRDVYERARIGVVSFHCSVERWNQPLSIVTGSNLEELRKGWDLIIDIDSKFRVEHGRAAAAVIVDFLKDYGITPTVKFSGRRGFHVGVAAEAFPQEVDFQPVAKRYPEVPRAIVGFIKEKLKDKILEALIAEEGSLSALTNLAPASHDISPYNFLEIEKDWGARHLFRAPYSLHEKTWLVSTPVKLFKLKSFKSDEAKPENVKAELPFLVNKEGEGTELLLAALDWMGKTSVEEKPKLIRKIQLSAPVDEQYFPPCIKLIVAGLQEGRKRSLFTLINFLKAVNWNDEALEKKILEVNRKHAQPLSERLVKTQIAYHLRRPEKILPANCNRTLYYDDFGICKPDGLCNNKKIKNPVNYAVRKFRREIAFERAAKQKNNNKSIKRR